MDPISLTTAALAGKAAYPIAGGLAAFSKAKAEDKNAKINSFIGRTRAIQTDTVARENLSDELGSARAVFGANSQAPGVGTLEIMQDMRKTRDRERRIEFGNRMMESADFRRRGAAARSAGVGALFTGAARAGPSIFDLVEYRRKVKE